LNGETDRVSKRQKSAIIAVDVRRFGHAINTDEVFGTHRSMLLKKTCFPESATCPINLVANQGSGTRPHGSGC
jgi:hypothetical protein